MAKNLYTIPAGRPFLADLAAGLMPLATDPLALARVTILLPTRRAVRSLREAFLRALPDGGGAGAALLLPRMRPIGDIDGEETVLADDPADPEIPPAIPELRRRLLLSRLVLRWRDRAGEAPLLPGQAAALAATLGRFLDAVASDGADLARIGDVVPEELAEHWQIVQRFLHIIEREWPTVLAAEQALDSGERRNRLLARQARLWRQSPPADPVVAAGLVGGVPAVTELLAVVAALPRGAVVLPGLDRRCDAAEWAAITADESHPQHLTALLLQTLDAAPEDVRDWGEGESTSRHLRLRLFAEALRPAATSDAWRLLEPQPKEALAGVARYDCIGAQHEALTIALLLRRKLENPGATAALVTPDRELARRVAAELRRWGVAIDDSAGVPLPRTPPGAFLRLVIEIAASGLAPVPLLAALKHPLAAGGLAPADFRDLARRLELEIRGPRPAAGFAGLREAIAGAEPPLRRFVDRLEAALGPLPELLAAEAVPLARLAAAHLEAAERLAATTEESGAERLWGGEAGEVAARFCHEMVAAAADFPEIAGADYPALFDALAAGTVVRPAYGRHPRLSIWGLVEARLQQADLVVLGGLNEGTWPAVVAHDPWMSRQMRRQIGLAVPERAIGIAASDFLAAIGAPEVALTRATRSEGAPTVPSRWLLRLDAVLRAAGLDGALAPDLEIADAALALDEPLEFRPLPPAEYAPPLAARPRQMSVTQIETWLRDPYAVYARHILALAPLDELDADPGRAELGTIVHRALESFARTYPHGPPEDATEELLRIGRQCFGAQLLSRPGVWAFWWPRFQRIVHWLVEEERQWRETVVKSIGECRGKLVIAAPGGPFTVTATADRIDRLAGGGFAVIDYKTGSLPAKGEIEYGFAPQLPLEGAILRDGSFGSISGTPLLLEYWRLGSGEPAGERHALCNGGDPAALIDRVLRRITRLIAHFDDPATPYLAVPEPRYLPRYSDYRHLERQGSWETEE
jgi:ATP-dependent helicase/nuclease subunit B